MSTTDQASDRTITVPEWQDDNQVTSCPICHRRFHFLFRKHHCRRCGRVICDQCSPHRITLPSQCIVRPPYDLAKYRISAFDDLPGAWGAAPDSQDSSTLADALAQAEKVRICKPCVPDPPPLSSFETPHRTQSLPPASEHFDSPQRSPERSYPDRYRNTNAVATINLARRTQDASIYYARRTVSNAGAAATSPRGLRTDGRLPLGHSHRVGDGHLSGSVIRDHDSTDDPRTFTRPRPMQVGTRTNRPARQSSDTSGSVSGSVFAISQTLTPSHRQDEPYDEQAECPVCGLRDPPFGPGDQVDEPAREAHIESCLGEHVATFSTPPPSRNPLDASSPTPSPRFPRSAGTGLGTSPLATIPITRARAGTASQAQRMLTYSATEKDCIDPEAPGQAFECVICLEDFEPGDTLARLECLCKFHRSCIRDWWESAPAAGTPGARAAALGPVAGSLGMADAGASSARWGSCPTHALHE